MADASEISQVRLNTGQGDNVEPYTDEFVSSLVDALGISGASAAIWRMLAAGYSTKVDVTEAGASHKFSDLFKNANTMAAKYEAEVAEANVTIARPRVNSIVRE